MNFSYPLKITSATNQLTLLIANVAGAATINATDGASALLRIA